MIGGLIAAWLDMRSKPLRTLAAIAGMIAAVTAVVLVDAAGVLSQQASTEYLARQTGLPVTINVVATTPQYQDELTNLVVRGGFSAVSRNDRTQINVLSNDRFIPTDVQLVSPDHDRIRVVDLVAGTWPQEVANSTTGHVVISTTLASRLGYGDPNQAIGQPLNYSPQSGFGLVENQAPLSTFIIDGVVDLVPGGFDDADMYLVSTLGPPVWMPSSGGYLIRINPADLPMVQEWFSRTNPSNGEGMFSWSRMDQSDQFAPVLKQQQVTARIVQIVALTVGGLGVLGVGLASVRERARDFGLRRALGASTDMVFSSVLLQSLLEAMLAAILALPLSFILLDFFGRQLVLQELPMPSNVSLPIQSVVWGVGCAVAVGIIAGLSPAIVAARSSVAQSLRA